MNLPSYFNDFLADIRLTDNQVSDLKTGHRTLRERLTNDDTLKDVIVSTFLQGSYRRSTAVRPKGGARSDVDVIVVTKLDTNEYTPEEAMNVFIPFLDKYYKDKYGLQGRSIGIELSYVDLDIVITAAPSESVEGILTSESVTTDFSIEDRDDWRLNEYWVDPLNRSTVFKNQLFKAESEPEWKNVPLLIPDREANEWKETDPLSQIKWCIERNKECNGHYVNVVKALKWWRKITDMESKHPKSYPLECLIGHACSDRINCVAEGITYSLENVVTNYSQKPILPDQGVPEHDVFARITNDEYEDFYEQVSNAAIIARNAMEAENIEDSVVEWKKLFGNKFPDPSDKKKSKEGYTPRTEKSIIGGARFAK